MFTRDEHGNSVLAIPGQGTQFDVHTSSTEFNGTRDDQLVLGYNTQPNGGRYNIDEPQIRLALEANYDDGIRQYIEWNLDTVTPDLAHNRRWMYLSVDRASPMTGHWEFAGSSFSLENYNSPANDISSEYFTVRSEGIVRLTSVSGQPAQIHLNTSDSSGYPGSYTGLVFQRGNQTKWIINNQGANGDTLAIVGVSSQIASFSQAGVFTSKGQRTAVTTKTAAYTATASDSEIRVDCMNGPVTITLPRATGTGQLFRIKKVDASPNAARIVCSSRDTIDGATITTLAAQYSSMTITDGAIGVWDRH
jgi:hypothetical protein